MRVLNSKFSIFRAKIFDKKIFRQIFVSPKFGGQLLPCPFLLRTTQLTNLKAEIPLLGFVMDLM